MADRVVLIHGLWMSGWEMIGLELALRRQGWRTSRFRYPSTGCMATNVAHLNGYLRALGEPVHLVAHSLGGLVALRMLQDDAGLPVHRLVALGTPFQGSVVARRWAERRWGRVSLGDAWAMLADGVRGVPSGVEVGVIAGHRARRWWCHLRGVPSDTTVAVAETRLSGAAWVSVPVTHLGLLRSSEVARLTHGFLLRGVWVA